MKKQLIVLGLCGALLVPGVRAAEGGFSDVPAGSWFEQGVATCAEKGVMVGTGEGRFSPEEQLSKAQCLALALRLYDLQRGGTGELEKAPENWERISMTLADGTVVEGTQNDVFGFQSFRRDAGTDAHLYFSLEPEQVEWGKSVDARDATVALNDKVYTGIAQCWAPAGDQHWVISFCPEEGNGEIGAFLRAPHPAAGLWYRDVAYTAERWGLNDEEAFPGFWELGRDLDFDRVGVEETCRYQFAAALYEAAGELPRLYTVAELPNLGRDSILTGTEAIYALYEAGVLTGTDAYGAVGYFDTLTRAQAAVMVARVLDEDQRAQTPPKGKVDVDYTLTGVDLKDWHPVDNNNGIAADWMPVERETDGTRERGIYRADGTLFTAELEDGWVFMSDGPGTRGDTRYATLIQNGGGEESLWAIFDVAAGQMVTAYGSWEEHEKAWTALDGDTLRPQQEGEEGPWGYVDGDGQWVIPAEFYEAGHFEDGYAIVGLTDRYPEMDYALVDRQGRQILSGYEYLHDQGGGLFYFHHLDGSEGLVTLDGTETVIEREDLWVMADRTFFAGNGILSFYAEAYEGGRYYDYAMDPLSEPFDWVGPLNSEGAGFVQRDGQIYRIQFEL